MPRANVTVNGHPLGALSQKVQDGNDRLQGQQMLVVSIMGVGDGSGPSFTFKESLVLRLASGCGVGVIHADPAKGVPRQMSKEALYESNCSVSTFRCTILVLTIWHSSVL